MKHFFGKLGRMVAAWTHPTAKYVSSDVMASGSTAYIDIIYRSNWTNKRFYLDISIAVDYDGNLSSLNVRKDTAFWPPFAAMTVFKKVISDIISNNKSRNNEENKIIKI